VAKELRMFSIDPELLPHSPARLGPGHHRQAVMRCVEGIRDKPAIFLSHHVPGIALGRCSRAAGSFLQLAHRSLVSVIHRRLNALLRLRGSFLG
jgi:hypothetical protein